MDSETSRGGLRASTHIWSCFFLPLQGVFSSYKLKEDLGALLKRLLTRLSQFSPLLSLLKGSSSSTDSMNEVHVGENQVWDSVPQGIPSMIPQTTEIFLSISLWPRDTNGSAVWTVIQ